MRPSTLALLALAAAACERPNLGDDTSDTQAEFTMTVWYLE